jgi:hypothetical protein
MRRLAVALLALLCGCSSPGTSPEPPRALDTRSCQPAHSCVDLVVAIDASFSSVDPIGQPVKPERIFGRSSEAGPGTKLWAATDGLEAALAQLDSGRVAVAVTRLTMEREGGSAVEIRPTNDFAAVGAALARIREREARDSSCHGCAARTALSLLTPAIAAGRCPIFVILADTLVTAPHDPSRFSDNEDEFAQAMFPLSLATPTLVALEPNWAEQAQRLAQKLAVAGARMVTADDTAKVTSAIVGAVETCE